MTTIEKTWDAYLISGEKMEEYVKKYLIKSKRHNNIVKMAGNFNYWDLISDSGTKYEIKRDYNGDKTGNLFFEIKWNNNWSGIVITKADWWVHCCKTEWYIFFVKQLKEFIKSNWDYLKKVKGGDDKNSQGVLIKRSDLDKMVFYETVDKQTLDKIL